MSVHVLIVMADLVVVPARGSDALQQERFTMRLRLTWLTLGAVMFGTLMSIGGVGCSSADRLTTYDTAMKSTVSNLRSGDFDGATASLRTASANADNESQRGKIADLESLISGADAYCQGDRAKAGSAWSETNSPEFKRVLAANQASLGVSISK